MSKSPAKVINFRPVSVGEGFRYDPRELLEKARAMDYDTLVIIGEKNGVITLDRNANKGETVVLLEKTKHLLVFGG